MSGCYGDKAVGVIYRPKGDKEFHCSLRTRAPFPVEDRLFIPSQEHTSAVRDLLHITVFDLPSLIDVEYGEMAGLSGFSSLIERIRTRVRGLLRPLKPATGGLCDIQATLQARDQWMVEVHNKTCPSWTDEDFRSNRLIWRSPRVKTSFAQSTDWSCGRRPCHKRPNRTGGTVTSFVLRARLSDS